MIVGRTRTLASDRTVSAAAATVTVGGRRCAVASGTALAVLVDSRRAGGPTFSLRDYARCSRSPRDAAGLFVTSIGPDRNRGRDGWVYKVDGRAGSTGAGDPTGAFGDGRRLRAGQRVLWFWCVMSATGCQRSLAVTPATTRVAPGVALGVSVRAYDDNGRATPAAAATVTLARASAVTDATGHATLAAPTAPGSYAVAAQRGGLVASFPEAVRVG